MTARQRSASSLSQHAAASNSSSPGGYNSNGSRDGPYRHDTDPIILSAAEIPSFHGDVMPITSYGDTYPAMTATYIPSGIPPSMSRPRAHTNSGSGADGQANVPSTAYGNLRPQTSRSSMLPMNQPGMGMRHVSTSALDSSSRQNYPGAGPNPIPSRSVPPPTPPQASNLPAHALNQREYQPHYASRNEYQRPSNNMYHPPGPPPLYTSQSSYTTQQRSVSHQGPPPQAPHGNGGAYLPHYQQAQYNVPKSQSDMYRMSQQSSDSLVSRLELSESEYNPSVQSAQSGNRSAPQSAGTGISRSGHAHSPLATSHSALTVTHEVAHMWTLDRVVNYLDRHNFSTEWQQAFKNLDVYGVEFLELGANRGLHSQILPEVMRINPQADESRERNNAKEIKKMIQDVLKLAHSTEEGAGHGAPTPMRQQGQRRPAVRSGTTDSYTSDSPNHRPTPSDSSARGRSEYTKAAFGSMDSVRQSPPITDGQNQSGHATRPSVGTSPHDSPSLGARHNHSNSSESVVSMSRAGEGKNDHKALKVLGIKTGRDKDNSAHEKGRQDPMEKRGGGGLFDKMKDFIRPKGADNGNDEDSPTSPGWKRELPFVTNNNGSSSSIDRASVTSLDGFRRNPPSRPNRPVYVFATRDSKTWMSLEITRIESVEELRKEICSHVGINDWQTALVYQTEVGQKVHEDFLKDNTLYNLCRNKADSYATLKFFVRPSPSSAVDSPARPQIFEEPESEKSSTSVQVAPLFHKNPESNTSALRQEQVIADLETKDRVESLTERGHVSPTVEHTVDELLSRLKTLKSHQETAGNPNIKVIPPGFALPGGPPANSQQGSVQQSPIEGVEQGYPTFGSTWEGDYSTTIRTADPSPIDGPPSAARDANELFLPQAETGPGSTMKRNSRIASGGTHALEAITRQGTGAAPLAAIAPTAPPPEKLRRRPSKPLDIQNSKFGKVAPTHGGRIVDFDNPRPSPYEDRKMDTLIPQPQLIPHREPPPPPANRTSSGSWSRLQQRPGWPEGGRGHAQAPRPRQDSVDNKPMVQIRERRGPSPSSRQNNNDGAASPGRGGIAAAMISAGVQAAGIHGTLISGTPRKDVPATSTSSANSSTPELRLPKFDSPASSERTGSRSSSPRLSWVMDYLFKAPDCVADSVPPAPAAQKLKLQIPTQATKQPTPEISPQAAFEISNRQPDRQPEGNHGRETQFQENNVEFDAAPAHAAAQDDDDSDSDDGLFAIPIGARQEKASAVDIPKTILETHSEEESTDSPRPTLEISTSMKKDVRFKSPATTSTTGSDSGPTTHTPPSPEYEEGDDRRGINSPSVYSGNSQPTSATGFSRSPSDYSGLNRTDSFIRDDVWASRPPTEALINNLDELFPNLDLDQPILDETNLSPPTSPTSAMEKPQSYQLSDPPLPTPISEIPELPEGSPSDAPTHPAPPIPSGPGNRMSIVAQRNINRTGLGRMKSIRDVVKDTHKKRYTQPTGEGSTKNDMLLRRKSTKFFGAKLIDMTPNQSERGKRGTMSAQQRQLWNQHQVATPATPGVQRQATFRWFKGQLIGKGTYGRVYLGMNATSGEFLAVKQVEVAHTMGGDGERRKEMIAALNCEIETMQHLDHVNIVQYLGCERKEYGMSIFLEYISGGSVGSCLRKHGRFTEPVVRSLTRQTLSGLQYLHSEGILHRDLKADNILLDVDGTCKISDFGISKKSDNIYGDDPGNSMQGSVFWMAPEVIRPEGQGYSAKIDIWSLGCVVLEMFAGRRPWSKEEAIGAIYKLGSERQAPPVPDDVSSVISPSAIGFLADCHTIDASERPTASTLLQDHEFCSPDPNFNFLDTELYKKIRP